MLSNSVLRMAKLFPQWMRAYSNPEASNTIQYLDAFGKQIDNLENIISFVMKAPYLTVDSTDFSFYLIDYIYKINIHPDQIGTDITSLTFHYIENSKIISLGKNDMIKADTIYQFYTETLNDGSPNLDVYYYDRFSNTIYMRRKYDYIIANGAKFNDIEYHHVWGVYDEIGLLLACPRLNGELNAEYTTRLFSVFAQPGNATTEGLKNYIARSFGIEQDEVILKEFDEDYILENMQDGITKELNEFITLSNKLNLSEDNSYWEIIEDNAKGLQFLPIPWREIITNIPDEYIQNGVMDLSYLEIKEPELEDSIYKFNYQVVATIPVEEPRTVYPPIEVQYSAITEALIEAEDGEPYSTDYKYRVIAGKLTKLDFSVALEKEYEQIIEYKPKSETVGEVTTNSLDMIAKVNIDGEEYISPSATNIALEGANFGIIDGEEDHLYTTNFNNSNKWGNGQIKQLKITSDGYLSLI